MTNIKVSDEEYEKLIDLYQELADNFEGALSEYVCIMQCFTNDAIGSGVFHDNLQSYVYNVLSLKGCFETEIMQPAKTHIKNYLSAIDEADSFLYDDTDY